MRKRTAAILASGAVLLIGGYVAWCGRSFYLKPRIVIEPWMPEELVAMLPEATEAAGMMKPEEFSNDALFRYLYRPYEKEQRSSILGSNPEPGVVVFTRRDRFFFRKTPSLYFILKKGRWESVTEGEYHNYRDQWNVDPWKKSSPPKGMDDLMREGMS